MARRSPVPAGHVHHLGRWWIIALVTLASGATACNLKYENGQYTTSQRKVVRVLTEEQYLAAQAANQRAFCAAAMAIAAGGVAFSAVAVRIRETG